MFVQYLGGDYMESFQPGLSFSPVKRAEIVLRLHGNIQPGVTQNCSSSEAKIFARVETKSRNEAILVYLTTKNLFLSFLHLGETVCCIQKTIGWEYNSPSTFKGFVYNKLSPG